MKLTPKLNVVLMSAMAAIVSACGGNDPTSATTYGGGKGLSCQGSHGQGQADFESVILSSNGGFYGANWWLPNSGAANSVHSLDNVITTIPVSPDSGTQLLSQLVQAGSNTLPAQTPTTQSSRALGMDGLAFHPVQSEPIHLNGHVTYNCDDTVLQTLVADNGTKVGEETVHHISTIHMTGPVSSSFGTHPVNGGFMGFISTVNPGLLNTNTSTYLTGSKFLVFQKTAATDVYKEKKCNPLLLGLLPAPSSDLDACGQSGTNTLSQALTLLGISPATGSVKPAFGIVGNPDVWIETAPQYAYPTSPAATTIGHRFAIIVGGELVMGNMVEAGAAIWDDEGYPHSLGSLQATSIWHRHANQQAANSIKQVLNF